MDTKEVSNRSPVSFPGEKCWEKESLQASEYLLSIFECSPVALISLDTRLRVIMFNRAAQELTGFKRTDILGQRVNKIISFERLQHIIKTLRNRGNVSIDGYITKISGSESKEIPVKLRVSPFFETEHRLMGILIIATDLREVRRLQAQLLEVERLTAITETAISINHEINNPLCSILGNTQLILMEKEKLDPRVVKKLQSIEQEIIRIQEIADRLARITRPVLKEYVGGKRMLDVRRSEVSDTPEDS